MSRKIILYIILFSTHLACTQAQSPTPPSGLRLFSGTPGIPDQEVPDPDIPYDSLPIGMNLALPAYYSPETIFTDAMKMSSEWITYRSPSEWDSGQSEMLDVDSQGYPTMIPQALSGSDTYVRCLVNNYYSGRYRIFYDGTGVLNGSIEQDSDGYFIDLDGTGSNKWIEIESSAYGDHIRNIRLLPEGTNPDSDYPTFYQPFLTGLEELDTMRFMFWQRINSSPKVEWQDQTPYDFYTQTVDTGINIQYAIELCNELNVNGWFCVPHKASDDYISQLAQTIRDGMDPGLKIYIEYSNEIWNWIYPQTSWVNENAPGAVNSYVSSALQAIEIEGGNFPEKDAYMMARTFSIFQTVFGGDSRLICVAAGQQAWPGNTERILDYLFNTSGVGCDVLAVGGYFGLPESLHHEWMNDCATLSNETMYYDVYNSMVENEFNWIEDTAAIANAYEVDYIVYEGGQHLQPYQQQDWCYNEQLWSFQISPQMYYLYMHNFNAHLEPEVDCQLFIAHTYVYPRRVKWGSWGHLESLSQLGTNLYQAPKYQALLDVNR